MRLLSLSILVVSSCLSCCISASAQEQPPAPASTVTIRLSSQNAVPISPLLYGINYDWNAVPSRELSASERVNDYETGSERI